MAVVTDASPGNRGWGFTPSSGKKAAKRSGTPGPSGKDSKNSTNGTDGKDGKDGRDGADDLSAAAVTALRATLDALATTAAATIANAANTAATAATTAAANPTSANVSSLSGNSIQTQSRPLQETRPKSTGHLWLCDDLPLHIPESRIFLYQYNSTAVYGKDKGTFMDKANELLEAIRTEGDDMESLPIIFLGHSMGGLLIKQALINAHNNPKCTPLKDATTDLAFFATPHHGGDWKLVTLGGVAVQIAMALGFQKGDDVLETLKSRSIFSDVMEEHWKHQLLQYDIAVPGESARFGMPGDRENVVKLNADHVTICKFGPGQEDQDNFELVLGNIKDLYSNALKNRIRRRLEAPICIPSWSRHLFSGPHYRAEFETNYPGTLNDSRKNEPKIVGIWGSGGVGKSQLAMSYVQQYSTSYDAVFCIEAGQAASINLDLLGVYQSLPGSTPVQPQTDAEDIRRKVLTWFTGRPGKFMIVFDGADDLSRGDNNFVDLRKYFPGSPNVHVIITSRTKIAGKLSTFEGVEVGERDEPQAVDMFYQCAKIPKTVETEAHVRAIGKELGFLALAITLAGSYVSQTPRLSSNLSAYLKDFRRRRRELLHELPEKLVHQYEHSMMTAWETSHSAVETQMPLACRVLGILAFINYDDIFLGLFGLSFECGEKLIWTELISETDDFDMHSLEKCFAVLERYSLVRRQANKDSYSMHRLIYTWYYEWLMKNKRHDIWMLRIAALEILFIATRDMDKAAEARYKLRFVPHLSAYFDKSGHLEPDIQDIPKETLFMLPFMARFTFGNI
ncbi:hypothetical protein B0T24DRAFT_697246 [Lasiosphaeria ovina]|uniref:NB-ARC domain-containing protein n=1 Tax=Lasiosphaeria ovina TaxID=92902 RepID=A0AAE0NFL6_9PEZI|nr:hypothetical protein B0T24DRAFT_697246 [Lasiosphaeria ovina]